MTEISFDIDRVPHPKRRDPNDATVYLAPGQLFFSLEPATVVTILGSCVAVVLWDATTAAGGINHYLLPRWIGATKSTKYGDIANLLLLAGFERAGIPTRRLEAKIYGGACVIEAFHRRGGDLGAQNVAVAREFLGSHRIPIVDEEVHGTLGMRLSFDTRDGSTAARHLRI